MDVSIKRTVNVMWLCLMYAQLLLLFFFCCCCSVASVECRFIGLQLQWGRNEEAAKWCKRWGDIRDKQLSIYLLVYPSTLYGVSITCNHTNGSSLWCFRTCIIFPLIVAAAAAVGFVFVQCFVVHFFVDSGFCSLELLGIRFQTHEMTYNHLSHLNGYTLAYLYI